MLRKKFNWLDGLLIALLLLIAAAAIWYFTIGKKEIGNTKKQYEVTFRFTQTTKDPYDFYQVGDTLYFYTRTDLMGTVTSLSTMDHLTEDFDLHAGKYIAVVDPQWKTIEMKVLVSGSVSNGSFRVSGQELAIGKTYYPQSNTTRSAMVLWNIEEVGA